MFLFDEPRRPRFSPKEKELHYKAQGGKCNGCGKKYPIEDRIRPYVCLVKGWRRTRAQPSHPVQCMQTT